MVNWPASLPNVTVARDRVLGGFVVFRDPLGGTPSLTALHVLAFALVVAAAATLAPTLGHAREADLHRSVSTG